LVAWPGKKKIKRKEGDSARTGGGGGFLLPTGVVGGIIGHDLTIRGIGTMSVEKHVEHGRTVWGLPGS